MEPEPELWNRTKALRAKTLVHSLHSTASSSIQQHPQQQQNEQTKRRINEQKCNKINEQKIMIIIIIIIIIMIIIIKKEIWTTYGHSINSNLALNFNCFFHLRLESTLKATSQSTFKSLSAVQSPRKSNKMNGSGGEGGGPEGGGGRRRKRKINKQTNDK